MNILEKRFKNAVKMAKYGSAPVTSFAVPVPVAIVKNKAPEGQLAWLPDDTDTDDDGFIGEQITKGESVGFELTFDEEGFVQHTIVVRDADGDNAVGVPLSIDKLFSISQWALANGLSQLDFMSEQPGSIAAMADNYALKETTATLDRLKETAIPAVVAAIDETAAIEFAKAFNERMDKELAAKEAALRLELEKEYAKPLLQLAKAIADDDDELLNDPTLQSAITRAQRRYGNNP